jgi:ABC-type multidrug transport system ATPase subunit
MMAVSQSSQSAIQATNLTRKFGGFTAVDAINFQIQPGSIFGFLGPNGSGKSTVIRMLCGLLMPSDGEAFLNGVNVSKNPEEIKASIGYTSQRFSLYEDLSADENIRFFGKIYGLSGNRLRSRRDDVVQLMGLAPYLDRLSGRLSGGWKQRLSVACALLHEPKIIFLDEPTAGIDPVARRELWDILFRLSGEGTTLFVTTHYMDEAERCSHIGYIYLSKLIVCGKPDELKQMEEVTPAGHKRLMVSCSQSRRALMHLRKMEGIADATLFGQDIHALVLKDFNENILRSYLEKDKIEIQHISEIEPSLEDVFVMLTRTRARKIAE